jgi:flagellar protein FlaI
MKVPNLRLRGALREKIDKANKVKKYPRFTVREPKGIVALPRLKNASKVDIKYPLLEPFTYAHIKWDKNERKLVYSVVEPKLSGKEEETLKKIEENITELLDVKLSVMGDRKETTDYIQDKANKALDDLGISIMPESYMRIMYYIFRNFVGINDIEALMHDPYIEDIGCSGLNTFVYVTHRKLGNLMTNVIYRDLDYLNNFVIKLSERCGRYISYATPLLNGTLPDGSRVQTSLAKDVTTKGPTFSIRKFRRNPFSPIDIINLKTVSVSMMAYLWFLIENSSSMIVCGGVSSGKTTMLNLLSMFIPPEEKVVSIEDVREINIPHDNWIPATTRTGFGVPEASGKRYGEIELFDLLRESFRMKPDYTIVGEVRGKEAYVMFQGMASGNPSLGTIHSGSVDDLIKRLQTPPIELSPSLIESLDAIMVMVNAREKGKSARRVKEIVEIETIDSQTGKAHSIKTFAWIPSSDTFKENLSSSLLLRKISFEKGLSYNKILQEIEDRKKVIEWMKKFDVIQFDEVCGLINLYYKDKGVIMEWVEKDLSPYKTKAKKDVEKLWKSSTGLKFIK